MTRRNLFSIAALPLIVPFVTLKGVKSPCPPIKVETFFVRVYDQSQYKWKVYKFKYTPKGVCEEPKEITE